MSALCTLEFDQRELKVAEAVNGTFLRHAEVVLPDGTFQDGIPTRKFGECLGSTLRAAGVTARRARLAISESGIAVRSFWLPLIPWRELHEVVAYEGKRLIPIDPSEVHYAWHVERAGRRYAVYLVAARREMIDRLLAAAGEVGLQVDRIDLKALALARGAAARDGIVLDWGIGEATLVLMTNARPRFFRGVLLDQPEADPRAQFGELLLSFRALVKFIRTAEPDLALSPTTPLYLAGRFAVVPGAEELAREQFGFAVRWPEPAGRWVPSFPWQAHLAGIGLLRKSAWQSRITPEPGRSARVAA